MANILTLKSTWLQFVSILSRLMSGVMIGIIIVFLLPLVLPYIEDATHYSYIRSAIIIERSITAGVKHAIPTVIAGNDISRLIVIILALVCSSWLNGLSTRAQDRAEFYGFKQNIEEWKKKLKLSDNAIVCSPVKVAG